MRVLRVLTRANLGGPARQLRALAPRMRELGIEQRVALGSLAAGESGFDLGADVPTIEVPSMRRGFAPLADALAVRALMRAMREMRADLVHTHTAKAGVLGLRAAARLGLPVVHSFHGHVLSDYFSPVVSKLFRKIEARACARRAAVTCVSASCAQELAEFGVCERARMRVIGPAVEAADVMSEAERRAAMDLLQLDDGALRIAWCGRLEAVKDPELLAQIVQALRERSSARAVQLRIFGSGSLESSLRTALGPAMDRGVELRFVGADPRFRQWISLFDVLLATSRREGLPVAAVEALLAGRAVLAPAVPGFSDLEGDGVTLVAREADAFAEALRAFAASSARPSTARVAALRAAHDPAAIAAAYADVYGEVQSHSAR